VTESLTSSHKPPSHELMSSYDSMMLLNHSHLRYHSRCCITALKLTEVCTVSFTFVSDALHTHTYMHTYMHTYIHACIHTCVHTFMYVCNTHVCIYACIHVCVHVHTYACMHACMHVRMYVCMYVCLFSCASLYRTPPPPPQPAVLSLLPPPQHHSFRDFCREGPSSQAPCTARVPWVLLHVVFLSCIIVSSFLGIFAVKVLPARLRVPSALLHVLVLPVIRILVGQLVYCCRQLRQRPLCLFPKVSAHSKFPT
jgi:hypothetical protein